MINAYITKYANFAYFDLELHDFDLDSRSHDIYHILSSSMVSYIKKNDLDIYPYTWDVGGNDKNCIFVNFDIENVPIDPKSTGYVSDLYPTMVPNTNFLGLTIAEKSGRQTDWLTHRRTEPIIL